jgi:hypothetical protein
MIKLSDLYQNADNKSNVEFANITEEGIYTGRLAAQILSKQDAKFVENGKEPRDQISYVFDLLNEKGESVHVSTKPCSISFGDKANLPKIWNVKTGEDLNKVLYDAEGKPKEVYVKCMVTIKETDNGIFPTVMKVSKIMPESEQPATKLSEFDIKVYGRDAEAIELTPDYDKLYSEA